MDYALSQLQKMLNACLPVVCIECIDLQNAEVRDRMLRLAVISNIIQRYELLAPLVAPVDWGAMTRVCYEVNGKEAEFLSAVRVVADGCYAERCAVTTPLPCPPIPK